MTGLQPCLQQGNTDDVESQHKQCCYVERSRSSGMASCHLARVHELMHELMQVGRQTPLPTPSQLEKHSTSSITSCQVVSIHLHLHLADSLLHCLRCKWSKG